VEVAAANSVVSSPAGQRDWVDAATEGATGEVGIVPGSFGDPASSTGIWQDVEFWNKRITRSYRFQQAPAYSPLPAEQLALDPTTGALRTARPARFLVLAGHEARIGPAGRLVTGSPDGRFVLVDAGGALRAQWATLGLGEFGAVAPDRETTLRLYADPRAATAQQRRLRLTLADLPGTSAQQSYALSAPPAQARGRILPGKSRRHTLAVCVPHAGYADLSIEPRGEPAGLRLADVEVVGRSRGCSPADR
jgi:hypothetical protein